jgi:hypothetical protein
MTKRFHTILALAALSAVALAAVDGITLARKPKKDEVHKYAMKADVDFGGIPVVVTATLQEKVVDVADDGTYTLEQTQIEGKASINGTDRDLGGGSPSRMAFKANGEVSKLLGDAATTNANAYRMANLGLTYFPDKAVNVGDTWSFDIKSNKETGAVAGKAEFKLVGEEKVANHDTYKIKTIVKETEGDTPASSDGNVWVDKVDGSMVKTEVKWVNAPFPGAPAPLNATVKIDRVEK